MIINTNKHISDKADSVTLKGSRYDNLQDFINILDNVVFEGVGKATATSYGIGILSTSLEDNDKLVTTDVLSNVDLNLSATESEYGKVKIVKDSELLTMTNGNSSVLNYGKMVYFVDNYIAKSNEFGFVKSIDNVSLNNYSGNEVAINSSNLAYGMDYMIPKLGKATTSNTGIVRIATDEETRDGKLRDGVTISPKKFHALISSNKQFGLVKKSTAKEFDEYNSSTVVTNSNLSFASVLFDDIEKSIMNSNSDISNESIGRDGYIRNEIGKIIGSYTKGSIDKYIRIGDIVHSLIISGKGQRFIVPTGQFLDSTEYKELFAVLGYKYGKSGTMFRVPDIRGLYFRQEGLGNNITESEKYKTYKIDEPVFGEVQKQMVARHKHGGNWSDQSKWGSSFGHTGNWGWYGSGGEEWGCYAMYQSDGGEIVSESGIKDYPNPEGMIDEDKETRPWSLAVNIYMRVK